MGKMDKYEKSVVRISVGLGDDIGADVIISYHDGTDEAINKIQDISEEGLKKLHERYKANDWELTDEKDIDGRRVYVYERPLDASKYPELKSKMGKESWMNPSEYLP